MPDPIPSELLTEMRDEAEIERCQCRHGTARLLDKAADLIERLTSAPAGYVLVPRADIEKMELLATNHGAWFENDPWKWAQDIAKLATQHLSTAPSPSPVARVPDFRRLRSIYDVLHCIYDTCEDEGDRIYLGSTNDHHTLKRQLRQLEKMLPEEALYPSDGSGEGK